MSIKEQLEGAKKVIDLEITKVTSDSSLIKNDGCASCHILFKLIETLSLNESDATDLLSETLYQDPKLNERITGFMLNNISKLTSFFMCIQIVIEPKRRFYLIRYLIIILA